jgi:hypothetical protein
MSDYEFMLTWCILQVVQALLGPDAFRVESGQAPAKLVGAGD